MSVVSKINYIMPVHSLQQLIGQYYGNYMSKSCGLYNNKPHPNHKQIKTFTSQKNSRKFPNQNCKGLKEKNGSSKNSDSKAVVFAN
jgi:NAD-dependent SIR2 family protein deacetylase